MLKKSNKLKPYTIARFSISYITLSIGAVICAVPFLWMVSTSLKSESEIFVFPPIWIPSKFVWENYARAWYAGELDFGHMFLNTLNVAVPVTIFTLLCSSLAAYAFARIRFFGRDVVFTVFLASLMIPYAPTIIPQFVMFREFGWLDSLRPLIVPGMFGNAFAIFFLRQFFLTLPSDLEDASMIDGASRLHIWW